MGNNTIRDYLYENEYKRPDTIVIINCVLNVPLIFVSILGNLLVLVAIVKSPSLRSSSIVFLCNLAVSDLLVGFVAQPLYISYELTKASFVYKPYTTMALTAGGVSISTMTAISLDRFLALLYHMRYPLLMTLHRAILIAISLWLFNGLVSLLVLWNMTAYYFAIAVSIPIYQLLSIVSYMRIYLIICRHRLKIRAQRNAVANSTQDYQRTHNMERKSKSAKNTFMYFVVMVVCYLPLFTAMIILTFYTSLWTIAWNLTDTIAFANSAINPFLYCWRLRELRTAVIKVAKRILCRQTEDN